MQHESPVSRRNLLGAAAAGAAAIGTSTLLGSPAQAGQRPRRQAQPRAPRQDQRAALHPARPARPSTSRPASPSSPRSATPGSSTPASSAVPRRSSAPPWTTPGCGPPPATSASRSRSNAVDLASARSRTPPIVGNKYIVHPFFGQGPNGPIRDGAVYRAFAADLNKAGALARQAGLSFGYHNHQAEFLRQDGGKPDRLRHPHPRRPTRGWCTSRWTCSGPSAARRPGRPDPPAPRPDPARCTSRTWTSSGSFADPGAGLIDFGRIFEHSREAGLVEYIVERDDAGSPPRTPADALEHRARSASEYLDNCGSEGDD